MIECQMTLPVSEPVTFIAVYRRDQAKRSRRSAEGREERGLKCRDNFMKEARTGDGRTLQRWREGQSVPRSSMVCIQVLNYIFTYFILGIIPSTPLKTLLTAEQDPRSPLMSYVDIILIGIQFPP